MAFNSSNRDDDKHKILEEVDDPHIYTGNLKALAAIYSNWHSLENKGASLNFTESMM